MSLKLNEPIFTKKSWGSEIIWSITSHFMAKTIEIDPFKVTDLIVYEKKEKSIIVIKNTLVLAIGLCCDEKNLEYHELPEGWTRFIPSSYMHRYGATNKSVRIIEIASPQIDEGILIPESGELGGVL